MPHPSALGPLLLPLLIGAAGGFIGSLIGLGGGILIVPLLTLSAGLPLRTSVAISLIGVVATSMAGSSRYLRRGLVDVRLALTLESVSIAGAIAGSLVIPFVPVHALALLFAAVVAISALHLLLPPRADVVSAEDTLPPKIDGSPAYTAKSIPFGLTVSAGAGILSGLLGIGGGIVKIPAMILRMGVPTRVALATSNYMIGLTAGASALVFAVRGEIPLRPAAGVALGVLAGATLGARTSRHITAALLRRIVALVLLWAAYQLVVKAGKPA